MKEILISIGVLMTMSFTTSTVTNIMYNRNLYEAIVGLEDNINWMSEDIRSGRIDQEIGELYVESFNETLDHLDNLAKEIK